MSINELITLGREQDGRVIRINLNRVRYANALNHDLVEALLEAVDVCHDERIDLMVLSGSGSVFCGGFDLRGLEAETDASLAIRLLRLELLLQKIHYAPFQTIGFSQGRVSGSGADLLLACRKRFVSSDASFRFPGIRFGILLGTNRLIGMIGDRAYQLLIEQQQVDADQAIALGLAHKRIDPAELDMLIQDEVSSLARIPEFTRRDLFSHNSAESSRDMGILASTVIVPGLQERIASYWERIKSTKNK